ncbi:excisionase family DNA-binding protein [Micromonospora sp. NPDC049836]|uniref:excisionase family DNA-binding protein n=1 Tax=Micromonospora sp. NPDC049836 TaxID=3364274 RepID=UPI0037AAE9B7
MDRPTNALMLTVEEAAQQLRIGRTQMFALIGSGQVNSVKIGRSRRVPRAALDAYVTQLAGQQSGAKVA